MPFSVRQSSYSYYDSPMQSSSWCALSHHRTLRSTCHADSVDPSIYGFLLIEIAPAVLAMAAHLVTSPGRTGQGG